MPYRPKLANGKFVPLSWPVTIYRAANNVCWPLEFGATIWTQAFHRFCFMIFLIINLVQKYTAIRYLFENYKELDKLLNGVMELVIHTDLTLRTLHLGLNKQELRKFLHEFYADIYIEKSSNPKLNHSILVKLRPTIVYTFAYIISTVFYVLSPFIGLYQRNLGFPMSFPFDITPLGIYLPIAFAICWLNVIMVTMLFGDANVMSEALVHLHGQYLMLNEDLQHTARELLKQADVETISHKFSEKLKIILERNVKLNEFAAKLQKFFSYRIFLTFSFSAVILCVLGFKTYTKVAVFFNISWMLSKVQEMLTMGEIGSTIIATSNQMSSMYYNSNWELIISCSTNTHENVQLMKLIVVAIETNEKPFTLTGLNFFSVSLTTVMKILRAAGSYFTCLVSIGDN